MMRRFAFLAWCLFACSGAALALESVTLQLKWRHQFQFAGYYAALEKGYYREAGLDVQFVEAIPATNVVDEVMAGRAHFGVGTSDLLLSRRRSPVVALAVIFQHSPQILLAREDSVGNLHQLAGRKVMIEAHAEELLAYMKREQLPPEKLTIVGHSQTPDDLIEGRVAAMSAYSTTEPYLVRQAGLRTIEFSPRSGGIDFYGDNLFTSERELKRHPERVRAFRAASLRGWEYAMAHPDEIIDLILARYNTQKLDRGFLAYEAARTAQLMQSDLVQVGYMNPGRWQHIADTYAALDMKPRGDLPEGFMYEDAVRVVPAWVLPVTVGGSLLIAVFGFMVLRNVVLRRELKKEIAAHVRHRNELEEANRRLTYQLEENRQLQLRLAEQAVRDPLSTLYNRRHLDEVLPLELARAKHEGYPLALVMIDLDQLKKVNDSYGLAAGDEVIKRLAAILQENLREGELAGRYGGDEFLVLMPHTSIADAVSRAEAWCKALAQSTSYHGELALQITLSAGVTAFPEHAAEADNLIECANLALYLSKIDGRNRATRFNPGS